ncbi:MAG: response regulator [Candidatus Delongbacteria bacterium]
MLELNNKNILIMVVDDEKINLRIVDSMLKSEGFRTILLQEPANTLNTAVTNDPDIILLDVTMPLKDGFTVCKELKNDKRTSKIPVLFLSGQKSSDFIIRGLEAGAQDYITKPFNAPELIARVETHIKLKMMFEQLVKAEQVKALHAAMVSQNHSLNQLTTSILGQVEILDILNEKENLSAKVDEAVRAIEKAALNMDKIIKKFTKISKIKFARYSDRTEMLDLENSSPEKEEI